MSDLEIRALERAVAIGAASPAELSLARVRAGELDLDAVAREIGAGQASSAWDSIVHDDSTALAASRREWARDNDESRLVREAVAHDLEESEVERLAAIVVRSAAAKWAELAAEVDVDLCSIEDCNRAAAESTLDHADVLGNPARRCEHHLAIEDDAALADELDNESEATS